MKRIVSFEQLDSIVNRLFVEVVCPKCGRILISSTSKAKTILVFGCSICGDIDSSMLLSIKESPIGDIQSESVLVEDTSQE